MTTTSSQPFLNKPKAVQFHCSFTRFLKKSNTPMEAQQTIFSLFMVGATYQSQMTRPQTPNTSRQKGTVLPIVRFSRPSGMVFFMHCGIFLEVAGYGFLNCFIGQFFGCLHHQKEDLSIVLVILDFNLFIFAKLCKKLYVCKTKDAVYKSHVLN